MFTSAPNESPDHVQALRSFRETARNNPGQYRGSGPESQKARIKLSDAKFLEALELIINSEHPSAVALDWDLSPFMPFNGDPTALGEQWFISRNQASETLWKIEHDELLEPWECTFARFEHAVQKESRSKVLRETRSDTKGFAMAFVIAAIMFLISLFLSSTNSDPFQFLGAVVILFALAVHGKGLLKLISFKLRGDDRAFSELDRIKRLIDKANYG
jgi:hypothetical protein